MRKEIWKDIPGYEKLYQVSNWGRVKSLDRWIKYSDDRLRFFKGSILKAVKIKDGYLSICLCKDGKQKNFLVHRLVWEAFNGEIPEGMQVNHINEDKTDCSLGNLNLLTHGQNCNWGTRNKRSAEKRKNGKLSKAVLQLTYPGLELICEWPSAAEAGRNGFSQGAVSDCCLGRRKSHKGVTFRYKEKTYSV